MAKTKIEVDLVVKGGDSVGQVEGKVVSLKQQLKNLKAELASGSLTGDEFNKAAKKAGELQDRIGDVSQRVKNLASDSQKLDGFVNLTQGIVGGFAAVQGITALVGDENEDLQKTMVKLQAAMSALAGIQAVANTLNKDSAALTALTTIKTTAQTAATTLLTFATGGATAAANAFRIALLATGIGAIVVLLIAVADKMDLFGTKTAETTEELKRQQEVIDQRNQKNTDADNADIARYARERDLAKARIKLRGGTNQELLQQDLIYLKAKQSFRLQEFEDDIKNEDKKAAFYDTVAERQLKELEILQDKKDAKQKQLDARVKDKKIDNSFDDLFNQLEQEATLEQEAQWRAEERDAQAKADQIEKEKKYNEELLRIQKEADDERIKNYLQTEQAKQSIANDSFSILNSIGEIALGQQFKQTAIGKTLALSQIATDTALAISSLVRASEANPFNAPTGGIAGAAQFVAGLAKITTNIAKAKTILSSGGSPSGGSGGTGSQSYSNPKTTDFIPSKNYTGIDKATKVYVLEKDITDSQGRVARIRTNAELI